MDEKLLLARLEALEAVAALALRTAVEATGGGQNEVEALGAEFINSMPQQLALPLRAEDAAVARWYAAAVRQAVARMFVRASGRSEE